jgi:DNA-binding GntR family transcriptional regulator
MISCDELKEVNEIITLIGHKSKTRVHRTNQAIDVGLARKNLAKNFSTEPKSPVLVIEREYYTRNGSTMFELLTYFRPDLYKYQIELIRT